MILFRRCFVLIVLMFWLGGLTFYGAVVIPIGRATIGQPSQSLITRQVSWVLNLAAAVLLVPLAWDQLSCAGRARYRWLVWLGFGLCIPPLHWLYLELVAMMDGEVSQLAGFYSAHRYYLWVSTLQWVLALIYVVLLVRAWRQEDGQRG